MKPLLEIAERLKRSLGRSSLALLETLELAVIRKYLPQTVAKLRTARDERAMAAALNAGYHRLGFAHRVTDHLEGPGLRYVVRRMLEASAEPEEIAAFLESFTIERSGNDLYGFSTPAELKELMIAMADPAPGESLYNPCFGIGGFFVALGPLAGELTLYGEETEELNRLIAGLTAQLSGVRHCTLERADALLSPAWCDGAKCRRFDRVLCNPPFDLALDTEALARDPRFHRFGVPPANAPELAFLQHAAATMEKKAVVLMRLSLLQRSSNEAKIRTKMAREGLIEAVVALPGGIVPHWKEPMALVLLSSGNENILFVDAAVPRFLKRRGRRNGIHRIGEIVETVKGRKETFYSVKVPLQEIEAESLAPSHYLAAGREKEGIPLSELTERIFRAQRVRAPQGLPFGEIGVGDMVREGFTMGPGRLATGNAKRVERFALRPFDILLPLRGNANRVAIVGEHETPLVPNAGVIVLRPRSREDAFGLYLHLLSEKGREELEALYGDCPGRTLNPEALAHWRVKLPDGAEAEKRVAEIFRLRRETERLEKRIEQLLREVPQPGPPPIS